MILYAPCRNNPHAGQRENPQAVQVLTRNLPPPPSFRIANVDQISSTLMQPYYEPALVRKQVYKVPIFE